jgi:hypothetical protein
VIFPVSRALITIYQVIKYLSFATDITQIALRFEELKKSLNNKNGIRNLLLATALPFFMDIASNIYGAYGGGSISTILVRAVALGVCWLQDYLGNSGFNDVLVCADGINGLYTLEQWPCNLKEPEAKARQLAAKAMWAMGTLQATIAASGDEECESAECEST